MRTDSTAWLLFAVGVLVPTMAHTAGLSFVLRDIDGGPYFLTSPLWFLAWQPLVLLGLLTKKAIPLEIGLLPGLLVGGGILLGSFVQLPLALLAPTDAIADTPRLTILAMHAAAMLTGAASVGLGAHLGSLNKRQSLD